MKIWQPKSNVENGYRGADDLYCLTLKSNEDTNLPLAPIHTI